MEYSRTLFFLVLVIVKISAYQSNDTSINPSQVGEQLTSSWAIRYRRAFRTITILTTVSVSSTTTVTLVTRKLCAARGLVSSQAAADASGRFIPGSITTFNTLPSACRRKRFYWNHDPVFIAFWHEEDLRMQFHRLTPSELIRFEPTMLPQFRNRLSETSKQREELVDNPSTEVVVSSFDKSSPDDVRSVDPLFFSGAISSLLSSYLSNALTSIVTETSTTTSFGATFTTTLFTRTATFFVVGPCYPNDVALC